MKQILLESTFWGVAISLFSFWLGTLLNKKTKLAIFNPILVAVALTICVLVALDIDYSSYNSSARYLSYLLTPATVCMAIPLYEQLQLLKKNVVAILVGVASGVLTSVGSISVMGLVLKLSPEVTGTLLPKSVTTAIGMPLAEQSGGVASIAAITIVVTGIVGNVLAESFLKLIRVTHPIAKGIAIGTSAHSVGTAKAMEMGDVEGAMSGLSIAVAGLMTVLVLANI